MIRETGAQPCRPWRHVSAALLACLALVACGGGESKKEAAQRNQEAAAASTAGLRVAEHFQEGVLSVSVIDSRAGKVVWTRRLGTQAHGLTYAHTVAANGSATPVGLPQGLVYLDQGQVRVLALAAPVAAEGTRASNVADACALHRLFNADHTGRVVWAMVSTQGADAQCGTLDDLYVLVNTAMGPTAAPLPSVFGPDQLLLTTYQANGQLDRLMGYAFRLLAWQFQQISADGVGTDLTHGLISPGEDIQYLGLMPGTTRQALVRVGAKVRVLDWATQPATLREQPLLSLTDASHPVLVLADADAMYLVDAGVVWKVLPTGVASALTTLADTAELGMGSSQTNDFLVLTQDGSTAQTVLAVHKRTGARLTLYKAAANSFVQIEPGEGNVAVIDEALAGSPSRSHLSSVNLDTGSQVSNIARHVLSLGAVREAGGTQEAARRTHVLWCEVDLESERCPSTRIKAQALAGGAALNLAPASLATTWWDEADLNLSGAGAPHALSLHDLSQEGVASSLWLLDPDVAGSLVRLP